MNSQWQLKSSQKLLLIVTITLFFVFLTISGVSAALYNINTNNNSVSDWTSVPVFLTDPSGDLNGSCSGGDGRDDIIETYVASGPTGGTPTDIFFRVRTASSDAIGVTQHWVGAYIDCAPQGEDSQDSVVFFDAQSDDVYAGDGIKTGSNYTPDNIAFCGQGENGERPADGTDTVEWGCDWELLSSNPTGANCDANSEAQIKIMTFHVTSGLVPEFDCLYDETTYAGFNIPTNLELSSFKVENSGRFYYLIISYLGIGLAIVVLVTGLIVYQKYQKSDK